jgi:hypothetical protein
MNFLTRNDAAGSSTKTSFQGSTSYYVRFLEVIYNLLGPQEWIVLPDAGQSKVCISFPNGTGAAYLQGTCSPPDMLGEGYPFGTNQNLGPGTLGGVTGNSPLNSSTLVPGYSPVVYTIQDTVTDITPVLINGDTAIRLWVLAGTVGLSVRC